MAGPHWNETMTPLHSQRNNWLVVPPSAFVSNPEESGGPRTTMKELMAPVQPIGGSGSVIFRSFGKQPASTVRNITKTRINLMSRPHEKAPTARQQGARPSRARRQTVRG